ncbi:MULTISPECIES: response regulator [unclassified Microbulbifer]|uniref:response regulator n=1 Tax=unclassified Microbulbifer TaxID=2619833 RepID=UPI0027E41FE2|nr:MULTISPECIES: response regulator [unclassified Microbulbifer]
MTEGARLLIVEDEAKVARLLKNFLQAQGYKCALLDRGDLVLDWLENNRADVMLLDVMLPGMDGMEVCRAVRERSTMPIIMLTARVEEVDQLLGLELGADDYICKPFNLKNVAARVAALLRRIEFEAQGPEASEPRALLLDDDNRLLLMGQPVELTATEYRILRPLYDHKGRIYTRSQLLDLAYSDYRAVTERSIDTHIKSIRKKIASVVPEVELIHSIYAMGYKWED